MHSFFNLNCVNYFPITYVRQALSSQDINLDILVSIKSVLPGRSENVQEYNP
jgi:hypothetical protein